MIQTEIKTPALQKRSILIPFIVNTDRSYSSWLYKRQQNQLYRLHTAAIVYTQPEVTCPDVTRLPRKFAGYIKDPEEPSKPQLCQ